MNDRPFIVDYLNLIRPPNFSYSHAANLFDKLSEMARELNVTIICNDQPFNVRGGESVYHPSAKLVRLAGKPKTTGIHFKRLRKMPLNNAI